MRRRFLSLTFGVLTLMVTASCSMMSHRSEVVVSKGTVLTNEWVQLSATPKIATTAPYSGVFVELPLFTFSDDELMSHDVERLIEGYLVTDGGTHITLVPSGSLINRNPVLEMSSPALQWSGNKLRITSIMLRSKMPIKTTKIVWVSDDPRDNKSGIVEPSDL